MAFSDVPGLRVGTSCAVRDLWERKDLGTFAGNFTAAAVDVHDSTFLMLTCILLVASKTPHYRLKGKVVALEWIVQQ